MPLGWRAQALRLAPAVVNGGLAYALLTEGSGKDRGEPPYDWDPRYVRHGSNSIN